GRILDLLRHADLGITGAKAVERRPSAQGFGAIALTMLREDHGELRDGRWVEPELAHRSNGEGEVPLPWGSESAGTHRIFSLAGPWLDILAKGHTACV